MKEKAKLTTKIALHSVSKIRPKSPLNINETKSKGFRCTSRTVSESH